MSLVRVLTNILGCLLLAFCSAGCDKSSREGLATRDHGQNRKEADTANALQEFDLGIVLARGQTLKHTFILKNPENTPVQLTGALAEVPCCSAVGPLPKQIPPNGEALVSVILKAGFLSGQKRVEFVISTDSAKMPVRVLSLNVELFAEWEVFARQDAGKPILVGQEGDYRYRIICRRYGEEGLGLPPDPTAAAPVTAKYVSKFSQHILSNGIIEYSRDMQVTMPPEPKPGIFTGSVNFKWANGLSKAHLITWEVRPRLRITPAGLTLRVRDEMKPTTVVVASNDRPFRIVSVIGDALVDTFHPPKDSNSVHVLRLEFDPVRAAKLGTFDVTIETDQPDQPRLSLSVLILP